MFLYIKLCVDGLTNPGSAYKHVTEISQSSLSSKVRRIYEGDHASLVTRTSSKKDVVLI